MPSAPIYIKYRAHGRCPRCGVYTRGRAIMCGKHRKMAREEKRLEYTRKAEKGICVWSGCAKDAETGRRMCKGHLTDNRVAAAERKRRAKVQKLQRELRARGV